MLWVVVAVGLAQRTGEDDDNMLVVVDTLGKNKGVACTHMDCMVASLAYLDKGMAALHTKADNVLYGNHIAQEEEEEEEHFTVWVSFPNVLLVVQDYLLVQDVLMPIG